jgi:tetratricopeptide (TPR) repeat protein
VKQIGVYRRICAVAAALSLGLLVPAWAQSGFDSWARCANARLPPKKRIAYCTRVLDQGGVPNGQITVLVMLGGIYRDLHQYAEAIQFYSRAVGYEAQGTSRYDHSLASPEALIGAYGARAETYAVTGQHDLAMADAAAIFRLVPDSAAPYAFRCHIRAAMKAELDAALADCKEAVRRDGRDTQVLDATGFVQFRLGHLKDAAADYDAAIARNSRLAGALFMRGIIKLREGDAPGGNADIVAAKDIEPAIADRFAEYGVTP